MTNKIPKPDWAMRAASDIRRWLSGPHDPEEDGEQIMADIICQHAGEDEAVKLLAHTTYCDHKIGFGPVRFPFCKRCIKADAYLRARGVE